MIIKIDPKTIECSPKYQGLCRHAYHNHPRGCPNFNKGRKGCPPTILIDKVIDLTREVYLIYTEFSIGEHAKKMEAKHPDWTEHQLYNCLYWQGTARKQHAKEQQRAKQLYNLEVITRSPEGHGVNVFELFKKATGQELENPPRKITRVISLGGYAPK